jgi:hypothetical protein
MGIRTLTGIVGVALAAAAIAIVPLATASSAPRTKTVRAKLNVTASEPPSCSSGICTIRNHGTGTMTPYGKVTFTTVITADGNQPPCGDGSQWVNRIVRTIHTRKGNLVLHEAGLQCPQPAVGPQVRAVWAVAGAQSTGIFAGARGHGDDIAYPTRNTAAPRGRITLAS